MNFITQKRRTLSMLSAAGLTIAAICVSNVAAQGTSGSGTFTDKRDGKTYKTVKIGKYIWMAENLNYKTGNSRCYEDSTSYCDKYGRLYDWKTARTACPAGYHLPSSEEWDDLGKGVGDKRLVTDDGKILFLVAGKKLKAKKGWYNYDMEVLRKTLTVKFVECDTCNGTDDYGFSALPGGKCSFNINDSLLESSDGIGAVGNWWTTAKCRGECAGGTFYQTRTMNSYGDFLEEGFGGVLEEIRIDGVSVRCVQGAGASGSSAPKR
ncbi:MAG: hypothetical protein LBC59_05205 [Chitinispirillales bacterium]|jgi:uncharacterized protein (TIGR02145 family)|nr:hypothetical protein [Chitinispirillales bacterium]